MWFLPVEGAAAPSAPVNLCCWKRKSRRCDRCWTLELTSGLLHFHVLTWTSGRTGGLCWRSVPNVVELHQFCQKGSRGPTELFRADSEPAIRTNGERLLDAPALVIPDNVNSSRWRAKLPAVALPQSSSPPGRTSWSIVLAQRVLTELWSSTWRILLKRASSISHRAQLKVGEAKTPPGFSLCINYVLMVKFYDLKKDSFCMTNKVLSLLAVISLSYVEH